MHEDTRPERSRADARGLARQADDRSQHQKYRLPENGIAVNDVQMKQNEEQKQPELLRQLTAGQHALPLRQRSGIRFALPWYNHRLYTIVWS